jgi:exonuclease VII large subunit
LAVLERGYAVCLTPEGKVLRDAESVELNAPVKIRLHRGTLHAKVSGKEV